MNLNLVQILVLIIVAASAGFFLRSALLKKKNTRIRELEREMISNHAEILRLHQEIAQLKQKLPNESPVVPMSKMDGNIPNTGQSK